MITKIEFFFSIFVCVCLWNILEYIFEKSTEQKTSSEKCIGWLGDLQGMVVAYSDMWHYYYRSQVYLKDKSDLKFYCLSFPHGTS